MEKDEILGRDMHKGIQGKNEVGNVSQLMGKEFNSLWMGGDVRVCS